MTTVCFTGHRPDKLGGYGPRGEGRRQVVRDQLRAALEDLRAEFGELTIITGMAQGVDQIGARVALEMGMSVTAAVPCARQENPWPKEAQDAYRDILARCTEVHVLAESYSPEVMQARNRWMVDRSDVVLAVWDGSSGGTANCVRYAKQAANAPRLVIIYPEEAP